MAAKPDFFGLTGEDDAPDMDAAYPDGETPREGDEIIEQVVEAPEPEQTEPALDETPPAEPEPEQPTAEPEPEGDPDEKDQPVVEGTALPREFLNKYRTLEDAEAAFNELRRTERDRAIEVERMRVEQRRAEEMLRVAAQEIQRLRTPQPAQRQVPTQVTAEIEAEAAKYGVDPETYLAARRAAAAEFEPFRQQQEQAAQAAEQARQFQAQRDQDVEEVRIVADAWVRSQDDLTNESWTEIVNVFTTLELDEKAVSNYDLAREIAEDPSLFATLRAIPDLVETDEGIAIARRMASGAPDTQPAKQPSRRPAASAAHVETGGSGATPKAPGTPADSGEWDVLKLAREEREKGSPILGV